MQLPLPLLISALVASASARVLTAQDSSATMDPRGIRAAFAKHEAMVASTPFRGLQWKFAGPTNLAVRSVDVALAERKSGGPRIYASYKTAGLWRSDDSGNTWTPLTEQVPFVGMHVVTVAPSNPDIVWIGTAGGVFKSVDAGAHWTYTGLVGSGGFELQDEATIGRIVIHPKNPQIVYVAVQGLGVDDNETRGVFRTNDGGRSWKRILHRGPRTGAIDLVMDPRDPQVLYASMWQHIYREGPGFANNNRDSNQTSIWKTRDGGTTWTEASRGLPPARNRGRMGIDISRSTPDVLYLLLDSFELVREAADGEVNRMGTASVGEFVGAEVYRTADGANSWTKVSKRDAQMVGHGSTYGAGFGQIRVDPFDENVVYTMGIELHRSTNGGKDFSVIGTGTHLDHRGLLLDPRRRGVFYDCTDGGLYIFSDNGGSFRFAPVPTSQFYNLAIDNGAPFFRVYGSVQDHHAFGGSISLTGAPSAFTRVPGYEASSHAVDSASTIVVTNTGAGTASSLVRGNLQSSARVKSIIPSVPRNEPPLRRGNLQPLIISRHDPRVLYAGFQYVYRSNNLGDQWERISPDLTLSADTTVPRVPGATFIVSMAESPLRRGLLYAGLISRLHVTFDDGKTWTDRSARLPRPGLASIVASAFDSGTVYAISRAAGLSYIIKSTDYGQSFVDISGNLSTTLIRVIGEDPKNPRILYAGTQVGIYVTMDGGKRWDVLGNLPLVPVTDIQFHRQQDLIVISTLGRGIWMLDARTLRSAR